MTQYKHTNSGSLIEEHTGRLECKGLCSQYDYRYASVLFRAISSVNGNLAVVVIRASIIITLPISMLGQRETM